MADKMMRIAGRGEDGKAKAVKSDNDGSIFVNAVVHKVLIAERSSSAGREIGEGDSWTSSPPLEVKGANRLTINSYLNLGANYTIEVEELLYMPEGISGVSKLLKTHVITSSKSELFELPLSNNSTHINVTVKNNDTKPFKIGLYIYATEDGSTEYFDEETKKFKRQEQIATEKTLKELLSILDLKTGGTEKKTALQEKPILKNIRIVNDVENIRHILTFHDGLFYASGNKDQEDRKNIYTSPDGVEWSLRATVPLTMAEGASDWITRMTISDTNRMIVGSYRGEVFVSDESGNFSEEPTFVTGKMDLKMGGFKHENLIGITTYENHGLDKKHEAWLSVDNGETFKKVFDTELLIELLGDSEETRVHIHDFEYDPYSGRLYIWQGDFDSRTFYYSDDWGKTWEMAFPRGAVGNTTQLIAVPSGLVFGADTWGGGIGFLPLDRSKNIKPTINVDDYINDYWKFNTDGGRYIACAKWVDRKNSIYLIPYIVEFDSGDRMGYIGYSKNGVDWQVLWQSPFEGAGTGFENVFYGNGLLVGTFRGGSITTLQTFIAEVDL